MGLTKHYDGATSTQIDSASIEERIHGALSDGVIGINAQGTIIFINEVACLLTGWKQADAINQQLEKIFVLRQYNQSLEPAFLERILKRKVSEAGKFIDAALHIQLVHKIDHAVIKQTIMHCSSDVMSGLPPLPHFVNISADLLRHEDLVEDIFSVALTQCTACGDLIGQEKPLVIEITEQQLLSDTKETKRILQPFSILVCALRLMIFEAVIHHYIISLTCLFHSLKLKAALYSVLLMTKKCAR